MNRIDLLVDRAANRLQKLADEAGTQNGLKAKLAQELADDADFLRKLKPSLIAARVKGQAPTDQKPGRGAVGPSGPQLGPRKKRRGREPNPFLIMGAAFVAGVFVAKVIDWRGHAHPRD
jgi:hypothetical protein